MTDSPDPMPFDRVPLGPPPLPRPEAAAKADDLPPLPALPPPRPAAKKEPPAPKPEPTPAPTPVAATPAPKPRPLSSGVRDLFAPSRKTGVMAAAAASLLAGVGGVYLSNRSGEKASLETAVSVAAVELGADAAAGGEAAKIPLPPPRVFDGGIPDPTDPQRTDLPPAALPALPNPAAVAAAPTADDRRGMPGAAAPPVVARPIALPTPAGEGLGMPPLEAPRTTAGSPPGLLAPAVTATATPAPAVPDMPTLPGVVIPAGGQAPPTIPTLPPPVAPPPALPVPAPVEARKEPEKPKGVAAPPILPPAAPTASPFTPVVENKLPEPKPFETTLPPIPGTAPKPAAVEPPKTIEPLKLTIPAAEAAPATGAATKAAELPQPALPPAAGLDTTPKLAVPSVMTNPPAAEPVPPVRPATDNPLTLSPVAKPTLPPTAPAENPFKSVAIEPPAAAPAAPPLTPAPPAAEPRKPLLAAPATPAATFVKPANTADVRTDFDVDLHDLKPSDTYESVSKLYYGDARYAGALRAFNRGQALGGGRSIEVPPAAELRKRYGANADRPAR